ncbi:MAG: toxin-antitoxin system YwqK family antitoxin [Bacteroidetes bacterium]|nr:toxin-antitoxin system YwqK family antitoxin [Bacteroidota bacterium]MBX7238815.1 toxin-antitoxin system YwqK family antitoxin [Bacteroidia bacterium]MCC7514621.1 toxin-antitoxin system YwqK family antitoxin [Bacteroidia bacterium]HCI57190.1 hypothetical protein [Bacteroidota bacterium]HMU77018.1 toxin-antitoxin system YwqK family antitoxin [Bacteroidia bacterium]
MFKTLLTIALGISFSFAGAQTAKQDTVMTPEPDKAGLYDCRVNFPDGRARAVGKMLNGKKEGLWRFYDTKGKIELLEEFEADVRNGLHLHFNENGYIEDEESYRKGILHGLRNVYKYGVTLITSENYNNGKLDGVRFDYYENGKLKEKATYKNGIRDGITIWFKQDDKPTIQYTYKNGDLNGPAIFYANGEIQSEGNYVNNNEEGEWRVYEDGKLLKTVLYKNGKVVKETAAKK